jgi:UDP-N-acetylmuramoylalanine--D-glutamate ligase
MRDWNGQHVLIIGAARQGQALARYLAGKGARIRLNDQRTETELTTDLASLRKLGIKFALGGHPLELLDGADLVCLSGGVPLTLPLVVEAVRRGLPLSNDSELFMEAVPCQVIGITGSAGKTTTTTLVGCIAAKGLPGYRHLWVGGNIGLPLIDQVDKMKPADLVVLELSSFQLEQMTLSPWIAAILNITPNHLDRHANMTAYAAAKAQILLHQDQGGTAVLNREDAGSWEWASQVRGRLVSFGLHRPPPGQTGTYIEAGRLALQIGERQVNLMPQSVIRLRGEHNLVNVLAACAIAHAAGLPEDSMAAGIDGFEGVAHRLEFVREWHGAAWYNDSIATAPERSMAAIRSFSEQLILLAGGRDKNLPWADFAKLVHQRVDHLVLFGEAADKIMSAVGTARPGQRPFSVTLCSTLREAVQAAANIVQPGDVVLLSPGGTSFDEFRDFEERGEYFQKWVKELT